MVGFLGAGVRFSGELVDLSTTGLLVRCAENLEPGTIGRLGVSVGHDTLRFVGVVRRRIPGVGVAFEFSQMTPRDRETLHRLLLRLATPLAG